MANKNTIHKTSESTSYIGADEQEALALLLGQDAFVTPAAMGNALAWLLGRLRNMEEQRKEIASAGQPEYATVKQLAVRYGASSTTMYRALRPLLDAGKVRVWAPSSDTKRGGDKRYNIADVERAYLQ